MTLRQDIGQLLSVGGIIGGLGANDQETAILDAVAAGEAGGLYLGYPHFRDPEHAHDVTERLQRLAPDFLFMAADFETGPGYNCANGCAHLPYLMGLGFIDDPAATREAAEITARQALAMGFNWLYTPCLDVNLCPDNPIIGIRGFGETPDHVSRMGQAFVDGFKAVGVLSTAKHFPGTGNTLTDTHMGDAQDLGDLETWEEKTMPPFQQAIRGGVDCVMSGHAGMTFLDPSGCPATFSRVIMTDVLRGRLGFEGIAVSDSLGMEGVAGETIADRCVRAFAAGCDVLITPFDPDTVSAFERALDSGRITREQLDASLGRIRAAKASLRALPAGEIAATDDARALEIGRRAAFVQRGGEHLPLQRGAFAVLTQWRNDEVQYFPREPGVLANFQHGLQVFDPSAPIAPVSRDCPETEHGAALSAVHAAETVVLNAIVKNYARDPYHGKLSDGTVALVAKLAAAGKRVVLTVLGSPYVAAGVPGAGTVICTGGDTPGSVRGALDLLLGSD